MQKCDNTCSAVEFLTEVSICFELLSNNSHHKIDFFQNYANKYYQQFMSLHFFLIDSVNSI